jgi:hypothetical protein
MAIPMLLNVAAVPFASSSIGARRIRQQQQQQEQQQHQMASLTGDQRAIIAAVMSEAAKAIQDVIRQPPTASVSINTDLTVPPNSPDYSTASAASPASTAFDFPAPASNLSSSEDDETPRRPRTQRKRRRLPSFKSHRVAPKTKCQTTFEAAEADDEDSDHEEAVDQLELKLKLDLVSQTQQKEDSVDEEDNANEGKKAKEAWSKVGEELRMIADRFGDLNDDHAGEGNSLSTMGAGDLLGLINLMVPVSVPQSLWSALVSYAAWKIFKRFQ